MKIDFVITSLGSGGAERTISYLSSFFSGKGHSVEVINMSGLGFYELDKKVSCVSLGISFEHKNIIERIANIIKRYVKLNAHINKSKPDVVFCMLPETARYILLSHKKKGFALITSERNNPEFDGNYKLKQKIFKLSDGVVFQTERARKTYSRRIQKNSVVIHNAVGNNLVYSVPKIYQREKKITAVGRLAPQKDYPTLLRAFKNVLSIHPEFTLEIFGNGPDREKLIELATDLNISSNVCFKGVHKDAILQIAASSCFVLSSKYEGMPNTLMEAMAVGLPCVSTDCPNGPSELISDGENGLLIPVGDVDSLSRAILRMIEDVALAEACGTNARKILDSHSVDVVAMQYLNYVESVVNKGR